MSPWPVLAASLIGSPHCAAMCGLIAGAAGRGAGNQTAYHAGRLAGYVALGSLAGTAGLAIDQAGGLIGLAGVATHIAGWLLVLAGVSTGLAALGRRLGPPGRIHQRITRHLTALAGGIAAIPPRWRGASLGAITALLPCGWLLAFVAVAGGTGRPADGAATMAVFWLGTVPGLAAATALIQRAGGPWRRRLPLVSAAVLIVLGLVTVVARPARHPLTASASAHDHRSR